MENKENADKQARRVEERAMKSPTRQEGLRFLGSRDARKTSGVYTNYVPTEQETKTLLYINWFGGTRFAHSEMAKRIIQNDEIMMKDSIVAWVRFYDKNDIEMGSITASGVLPYKIREYITDAMNALEKIPPEGDESETARILEMLRKNMEGVARSVKMNLQNTKGRVEKYRVMFDFY